MAKKNEKTFEHQMQRLQYIVQELERVDLPLEESVALYKEGRSLATSCRTMLEEAKNEISKVTPDGTEVPFGLNLLEGAERSEVPEGFEKHGKE